ncbi:MAG: hypothetical protein MJ168_05395 [Clostridia bacterium]|nr:hypothetical protein [Clostridia bacterium]
MNYINSNYTRTPKSKIVVMDELGTETDGITYTGEADLVTYPKINHTTTQLIGGFPSKTCEFEIYNRNNTINLNGKEIAVYRGLVIDGTTIWVPMGIFKAEDTDIKTNINKRSISFKGTDRTRLFERKYTDPDGITTSKTLLWLAQQICVRNGVTLNGSIPLSRLTIHSLPNVDETTTDRQMIGYIAELNGCIAMINRSGELVFKKPSVVSQTIPKTKYKSLSYEKQYGPVNSLYLGHEDYEDTIRYPEAMPENEIKWVIKDNPIVDSDRVWWLDVSRVPSQIIGRTMIPFEITELIDDFIYDIGDIISVTDKNGNTINVTVLSISTTSRIKSTFKADVPTGHEAERTLSGSVKEAVNKVSLKVDHLNNEITAFTGDVNSKYAQIKQTVDGFEETIEDPENGLVTQINRNAQGVEQLTSRVENIKIGSRNLLLDSSRFESREVRPYDSSNTLVTLSDEEKLLSVVSLPSGEAKAFRVSSTSSSLGIIFVGSQILGNVKKVKPNTVYTFSFWAKTDSERTLKASSMFHTSWALTTVSKNIPVFTNEWQYFVYTFRTGSGETARFNIRFIFENSGQSSETIYLSSLQLEESTVPSDWHKSDNDFANEYLKDSDFAGLLDSSIGAYLTDYVQSGTVTSLRQEFNTGITQTQQAIALKADSMTVANLQNKVDNQATLIASNTAAIETKANQILSTVSSKYYLKESAEELETAVAEAKSYIDQTASNLTLAVQQKTSKSDVENLISASIDLCVKTDKNGVVQSEIALNSNRISISSTNFTLTKAGDMTAKSGNIGGWEITNTYLAKAITNNGVTTYTSLKTTSPAAMGFGSSSPTDFSDANFRILHNGEAWSGKDTDSQIRLKAGHIDFYYAGSFTARIGQTGNNTIAFEKPAGTIGVEINPANSCIYMTKTNGYLCIGSSSSATTLIGMSSTGRNLIIGSTSGLGDAYYNVPSGKRHIFNTAAQFNGNVGVDGTLYANGNVSVSQSSTVTIGGSLTVNGLNVGSSLTALNSGLQAHDASLATINSDLTTLRTYVTLTTHTFRNTTYNVVRFGINNATLKRYTYISGYDKVFVGSGTNFESNVAVYGKLYLTASPSVSLSTSSEYTTVTAVNEEIVRQDVFDYFDGTDVQMSPSAIISTAAHSTIELVEDEEGNFQEVVTDCPATESVEPASVRFDDIDTIPEILKSDESDTVDMVSLACLEWKAIKELITKLRTAEARISQLEGAINHD